MSLHEPAISPGLAHEDLNITESSNQSGIDAEPTSSLSSPSLPLINTDTPSQSPTPHPHLQVTVHQQFIRKELYLT